MARRSPKTIRLKTTLLQVLQRHPKSCGAAVIAMVARISIESAEFINGIGLTPTRQMVAVLRALKLKVPRAELVYITKDRQPRAGDVVRIKWPTGGHWVVKAETGYFDPVHGHVTEDEFYKRLEKPGVVSSFLPIGWNPPSGYLPQKPESVEGGANGASEANS